MKTRSHKKERKKLIILVVLLLTLGIGLGYAVLSEQLKLNGSVNYDAMSWDVGFTTATDGGGTVTSSSSISTDKKSVTIACNLGTSTSAETCIAKIKIKNNSSFAVELDKAPTITFDNTYINSVTATWTRDNSTIEAADSIGVGVEEEIEITIATKELTKEMLPESTLSIPVTISMDWVEEKTSNDENNKITLTSIDDIAYENLSYRDLFINNNKIEGLNFIDKNDLTNLGDWSKNGSGAEPSIDTTNYVSSPSSMRIDATASSQYLHETILEKQHTYYYAAKVSVERHVSGYLGISTGDPNRGDRLGPTITSVTNGFETVSYKYTLNNADDETKFYIGSMNSANLTGNIDSIVLLDLTNLNLNRIPNKEELDQLYEEFIKLYNGKEVEKERNDYTAGIIVDNNTARRTFYDEMALKTKSLNMKYESTFNNASGLEEGAGSVTIQDLVLLGVMAQNNKNISDIWKNSNYTLSDSNGVSVQNITSTVHSGSYSSQLSDYYTVLGGKTGSSNVFNLLVVVQDKTTGTIYVGAVSSDKADSSSDNRFANAKILFDIAVRLSENKNADISDLESQLKSTRASVCIMPADTTEFLTKDLFASEYHLYTKGANDVFYYASVQKVVSILTALDYVTNLDEKITIVESDLQRGSGPSLIVGHEYTIKDALYGMLLPSSNSFAEALAREIGTKIYLSNS